VRWRRRPRPIAPPLDEHGHFPAGGGHYDMWHMAAWIPHGRETDVAVLLAGQGIEVYRMWPVSEPHAAGGRHG